MTESTGVETSYDTEEFPSVANGAKTGAMAAELQFLADAWGTLPEDVRRRILELAGMTQTVR